MWYYIQIGVISRLYDPEVTVQVYSELQRSRNALVIACFPDAEGNDGVKKGESAHQDATVLTRPSFETTCSAFIPSRIENVGRVCDRVSDNVQCQELCQETAQAA